MSAIIRQERAAPPAHDEDFVLWAEAQAEFIRNNAFELVDTSNLIDELTAMAGHQRRELKNRLTVLLAHLLKCKYQPERKTRSWHRSITEQRNRIAVVLDDSPSLKGLLLAYAEQYYAHAVREAVADTGLPASAFPETNPFGIEQVMDPDFLP